MRIRVAAVAVGLVVATTAAARVTAAEMPSPPTIPALTASNLTTIYQRNHDYIAAAEHVAVRTGDPGRAGVLAALAAPGRDFLSFSPVGDGEAVEVIGDLAHAERIVVVVPGSDTTLDTFDSFGTRYAAVGGAARDLAAETHQLDPGGRTAVIAWFGYPAPRTRSVDVMTMGRAEQGAVRLRQFLRQILRVNRARLALVCHSYGTAVCATALHGMPADVATALSAVEVVGSPGLGVPDAAAISTRVPLWAGRGTHDLIELVPHVAVHALGVQIGFGADPIAPGFGARALPVGAAAHGQYFAPNSLALHSIAQVALGRTPGSGAD